MSETPLVPEYAKLFVEKLKPLSNEILDSFLNRPVPDGKPYCRLEDITSPVFSRLTTVALEMTSTISNMKGFSGVEDTVSEQDINESVYKLRLHVREAIGVFHYIWKRPFPAGLCDGQPLISAVAEMILKDILAIFAKIIDIVEKPDEALSKYGSCKIRLSLDFSDSTAIHFTRWMEEKMQSGFLTTGERIEQDTTEKYGSFSKIAGGIIFGWWIGSKD
ncbi:MAG: hypothetical protein HZA16_12200 [Nitrospirae bacterium]|nr:hypothetical protein [Nitrospirota bacterium]